MSIREIKIETLHAGQPRPYADSVYEFILEYKLDGENFDLNEGVIKKYAKALCRDFNESEEAGWWEGKLRTFEKISIGKWHIVVIEPYTD
jgi:hypothetical protein